MSTQDVCATDLPTV